MVWVLIIPAAILVVRNRPEEIGLYPDGASEPVEEPGGEVPAEGRTFWRVVASMDFWFLALALAAGPFVVTALVFHQISILDGNGLSPGAAAGVFVPFAAASAAGTALSGVLAERLGPKATLIVSLGLLLAAVLGLQLVSTVPTAIVYSVLLGAAAGAQGVVAGMIWAHFYGRGSWQAAGSSHDGHDLLCRPPPALGRLLSGAPHVGRDSCRVRGHDPPLRPRAGPPGRGGPPALGRLVTLITDGAGCLGGKKPPH
jgi:hypothetical protein